ncbi:vitamin B12-binding protein [Moorella thermoacetica]|uniref:Vitamin B12-binding protein n=1 Tax=Neomoorella thermoacetica TaxID=1525 RepID=A0A1J5JWT3_NEOTH|nr:ABC transporter substrate-binding protein [Moorella thermoacetica]OIQ08049.1 vitamin B12-binding protein [Moorella thermoacetica]
MLKHFTRKWVSLLLAILILAAALAGCGSQDSDQKATGQAPAGQAAAKRTITDMAGRQVAVPGEIKKVFATSPVGTILVYTLAPEKLAGWNYDLNEVEKKYILPEYQKLPNLGGWYAKNTANIEEILKIHPQVIISMGYMDNTALSQAEQIQKQLQIPVVMVDGELTKLDQAYEFMGDLLGDKQRARELAAYCRDTINGVAAKVKALPADKKVRVYYAEGPTGLQTDPAASQHTQVLDFVGGINVAAIPPERGPGGMGMSSVSLEQVLSWDPDVILSWNVAQGGAYEKILKDPKWQNLTAVKNHRVYQVPHGPFNWFDRPPSVNRIIGVKWLANLLYPDVFNYDLVATVKDFYARFYHYNLSDQEADALLAGARGK